MKAWIQHEFGDPSEVLRWQETKSLKPGKGQLRIRVLGAGLNFPDLLCIQGKYQVKPELPFTPGAEAFGIIEACGPDCQIFKEGNQVMGIASHGAFAEEMLIEEKQAYQVPENFLVEHAAGFLMTHQTSYFALVHRAALRPGETLLVHGGSGGVGTTAIQIGKTLGARVFATAGTDEKLEICRQCGADEVLNYEKEDFTLAVKEWTAGKGADVIYDPVGGEVLERSTKCIAWEGRLLVIGFAGGTIPKIAANRILLKNISVIGLYWGNYMMHNPTLIRETQQRLYALYEKGKIKPVIHQTFQMDQLQNSLELLSRRKIQGKLVLVNSASG